MKPRYLLDTNICIYIRRRRPPKVLERFRHLTPGETALSIITYGELLYGAEKSVERAQAMSHLQELISFIPVLLLPEEAGATYGSVRARLEKRGEVIGNNDLWIAAHALAEGLTLVTNNEREFQRVDGLEIENWAQE